MMVLYLVLLFRNCGHVDRATRPDATGTAPGRRRNTIHGNIHQGTSIIHRAIDCFTRIDAFQSFLFASPQIKSIQSTKIDHQFTLHGNSQLAIDPIMEQHYFDSTVAVCASRSLSLCRNRVWHRGLYCLGVFDGNHCIFSYH